MAGGLNRLMQALDATPAGADFFLRDDDAGWDDKALFALLDCTGRAGVPIDLAVIPQATGPALAAQLLRRAEAVPGLLGLHQHGWSHTNHEAEGRKCEFGASRSVQAQQADLQAGRQRLQVLFGARLDPIFTPPWNRCSTATPPLLAALGYAMLSRSRGATPQQQALPELPVAVDWCKERRLADEDSTGARGALDRVAHALAVAVADARAEAIPTGLMLHHAAMDAADLDALQQLLAVTRSHARARWRPMRELLPAPVLP